MNAVAAAASGIAMLAAFACAGVGAYLLVKRREQKKALLMLTMAAVLAANVLIWTL